MHRHKFSPNNLLDAQAWTEGRAIFASGSPFSDIVYNNRILKSAQCNNSYIFPGLALGASLCQPKIVTDQMFRVAADALVELITEQDIQLQSCVKIGNLFSSPKWTTSGNSAVIWPRRWLPLPAVKIRRLIRSALRSIMKGLRVLKAI